MTGANGNGSGLAIIKHTALIQFIFTVCIIKLSTLNLIIIQVAPFKTQPIINSFNTKTKRIKTSEGKIGCDSTTKCVFCSFLY